MLSQSIIRRILVNLVIIFILFIGNLTIAQTVKGILVDNNGAPQPGIELSLSGTNYVAFSNGAGVFRFYNVTSGSYTLSSEEGTELVATSFNVEDKDIDLGEVILTVVLVNPNDNQITVISVDDLDQIEDDESASISSLLTASRDPFDRAVAFNLGVLRFNARGYRNEDREQYLNGMYVNDLDDGRVFWNNWGGLNDVLRVQTNDLNLRDSDFAFGGLGGASNIDLRASVQRVQKKAVYSLSNRSYRHRIMYTHSTGMMDNGWAFTFSGSKRWANSGFVEGTHYDAYSYFASIDKRINSQHSLNFVVLGAPLRRGKIGPVVQEAKDLAGTNYYNPNWGYQAGEVRNAREDRVHQPIGMLRHDWKFNEKNTITTTVGLQNGKYGNTRLNWYLAPDPRPDYYRKLPSFALASSVEDALLDYYSDKDNLQLDWDNLYKVNRERQLTVFDANGVEGNDLTGNLSGYIIEEQRFDTDKFSARTVITHNGRYNIKINGGLHFQYENTHNFKVLDDLLGGEFYVDYDDFALRDFPENSPAIQNDLNNPDRILLEGDRFGWDYDIVTQNTGAWAQIGHVGNHLDVFGAGKVDHVSFYRDGKTKVGKFPDSSFGKSSTQNFLTYGTKAGVTYKVDGRNYIYAVGGYRTRAPFSRFAYISPRTREGLVDNLTTEKILTGEAGYNFRFSNIKGRVSAYYTDYQDQLDNSSFYFDQENTFVNYIMNGIDKTHSGLEAGVEVKLPYGFSIEAAGAYGQNKYTSRPTATISQDNSATRLVEDRTVYIENFYVPGAQSGASLTLRYNSKKYWFASITGNFVTDNYLDFNPDRRTVNGVDPIVKSEQPELWNQITAQEKLPSIYTLNFFGGKSWRIDDYYVAINLSVGNLLNATDLITGGFEQFRFDYDEKDVNRFPPKYFHGFGRNFSLNFTVAL